MFVNPNWVQCSLLPLHRLGVILVTIVLDVRYQGSHRTLWQVGLIVHNNHHIRLEARFRVKLINWLFFYLDLLIIQFVKSLWRNIIAKFRLSVRGRLDTGWVWLMANKAAGCTWTGYSWEKVNISILHFFLVFNGYIGIHALVCLLLRILTRHR